MMGIDVPVNTRSDVLGLNLVHHQHAMISAAFSAHGNWTGHYSWGQLTHQMTESTERPRRSLTMIHAPTDRLDITTDRSSVHGILGRVALSAERSIKRLGL